MPVDTEGVYVLDGIWKDKNGNPALHDDINPDTVGRKIVHDEKGRIIYTTPLKSHRMCFFDTCGAVYFHYDSLNRVIGGDYYSYEKGVDHWHYQYNAQGKLTLKTATYRPDLMYTRREYAYNKLGQLDSVVTWNAFYPERSERDSSDIKSCSIKFIYSPNGLIQEAITFDHSRFYYSSTSWKDPDHPIDYPADLRFRYIYVY